MLPQEPRTDDYHKREPAQHEDHRIAESGSFVRPEAFIRSAVLFFELLIAPLFKVLAVEPHSPTREEQSDEG